MNKYTRRELLKAALLGGVGATMYAPREAVAQSSAEGLYPDEYDPGFVWGRVVSVGADGDLTVVNPDDQLQPLRLHSLSQTWKVARWNQDPIAQEDCIYARGERTDDGVLYVDKLWANISTVRGKMTAVSPDSVTITTDDGRVVQLAVIGRTEIKHPDRSTVNGTTADLLPGQDVYAVFFYAPANGEYTASLLVNLLADAPVLIPEGDAGAAVEGDVGTLAVYQRREGVATWFCCGGVGGCGSGCGGGTSGGSCGNCRSDRRQMAWQELENGCTASCFSCCRPSDWPRLRCGQQVKITHPCKGISIEPRVRDCGPNARCGPDQPCKGYHSIWFDLTPCAYTAIGGNLNDGLNSLWATPCAGDVCGPG